MGRGGVDVFFVPETKGLRLEEVDRRMGECKPRNSANWKAGEASERGMPEERKDEEMGMHQRQSMFHGEDGRSAHVNRDNEISTGL